jgi:hypothetical protein
LSVGPFSSKQRRSHFFAARPLVDRAPTRERGFARMRALSLLALLVIGAAVTTTVAKAASNNAREKAEGVSSLTYAPKPFYDNRSRMKVRFTTTGRARPGFNYLVTLLVSGPSTGSSFGCDATVVSGKPGSSVPRSAISGELATRTPSGCSREGKKADISAGGGRASAS